MPEIFQILNPSLLFRNNSSSNIAGKYFYDYMSLMSESNKNCNDYRFGFNGKENDNEVKGTGNSVDFGARIYDSRLGRFLSIDPFADKNVSFSPYAFADDNPIIYIDQDGNFRMSPRQQRKYPQLTNMLKNIQQTVHDDPQTWAAFKETLGLTDEEANGILEWGKGPKVRAGALTFAYAKTNPRSGNITIAKDMVKQLEGKRRRDWRMDSEGLVFMLYNTTLHEGQHTAEVWYGKTLIPPGEFYDPNDLNTEAGLVFEVGAMGDVITEDNANILQKQNHESPKGFVRNSSNRQKGDESNFLPETPIRRDESLSKSLGVDTSVQKER